MSKTKDNKISISLTFEELENIYVEAQNIIHESSNDDHVPIDDMSKHTVIISEINNKITASVSVEMVAYYDQDIQVR